jgi:putative ABC transport system ATP-binding protein
MSPTPLLHTNNLSHAFDYPLFNHVNFSLDSKQSKAIIGRSGSGKSTLLHILSTFLKPNQGQVTLFGEDLYQHTTSEIEALRRYDIGVIFQFHYLFKGMSALQNIHIASMLSGEDIDPQILKALEIDTLMHKRVGDLSGGQQQRISIARVLSKQPRIIFADEPTGNLDYQTASLVMEILLSYIQQHDAGLILVTHDANIAKACDATYQLHNQQLTLHS